MSHCSNYSHTAAAHLICPPADDTCPPASITVDSLIEFVRAEQSELLRFLTWKVNCPSAAADLVQELYLRVVTLANPVTIRNPRTFLYTTAKHLAIDYLRQKDRARPRSQPLDQAVSVPASTPDAETAIDAKHRLAAVLQAIEELPPKRRAVFILFKFEHKTYVEIAHELHISIRTVENHLTKAMTYCRARFESLDQLEERE